MNKIGIAVALLAFLTSPSLTRVAQGERTSKQVFLVPNFHPASCGWLTDFSTERNYCAYSYLDHLDRVRDDPKYAFGLSEVNNLMAIMAFEPERIAELKQRIREGRAELVNAFFLEPTINLSGGEALVKMGVEGLRWQQSVMGVRPRLAWMIDVTGVHEQMAQIVAGLGLDGMVYTRDNSSGQALHRFEAPDGTRTLAISPGHYAEWSTVFNARAPLDQAALEELAADAKAKERRTPPSVPVLVLGGGGDYSLPPAVREYPTKFLQQLKQVAPEIDLRFTVPSQYLDAVLPLVHGGKTELPVVRSGARLSWTSFWIQNPTVKQRYRRAEHDLQAAEAMATIASLKSDQAYPTQPLYHGWLQMLLNMDRNTLWGAAGGMVFEHPRSWDVKDRFDSVDAIAQQVQQEALRAVLGLGDCVGLFNPLSWQRNDLVLIELPRGKRLAGVPCQTDRDGRVLLRCDLPALATAGVACESSPATLPQSIPFPEAIETRYYRARIDPQTGALISLQLKPSGREVLAGPVLLVAESGQDGHNTPPRPQRKRLADSAGSPARVSVTQGPLATVVDVESTFYGGRPSRQTMRFYKDSPRIDFETEISDIPNATVVVAEFPLASPIGEVRRGIPYGFSHGAWSVPNEELPGYADGIQAAIRWSHYQFENGGGVAILDRGLPGRELNERTPVLFLLNAQDTYLGYPCRWLSGKGTHRASFALLAHDGDWKDAGVPQSAWEFNGPPIVVHDVASAAPSTSVEASPNVIVQALRREGADIEIRMAECLGLKGTAEVRVELPHGGATLTDLTGGNPQPLSGGPTYRFSVRPQQIVTLRLKTERPVDEIQPLLKWDPLVPPDKLPALQRRLQDRKGHPPRGSNLPHD